MVNIPKNATGSSQLNTDLHFGNFEQFIYNIMHLPLEGKLIGLYIGPHYRLPFPPNIRPDTHSY